MSLDGGDPAREHRRKGKPSPATRTLLERWQAALRAELADVLTELRPTPPADGMPWAEGSRPKLETRTRLVELGIRIARELGTEVDESDRRNGHAPDTPARPRPRSRVDFGGT